MNANAMRMIASAAGGLVAIYWFDLGIVGFFVAVAAILPLRGAPRPRSVQREYAPFLFGKGRRTMDSRSASNPATTAPGSQPRSTDSSTVMLLRALAVFWIAAFPLAALAQQKEIKIGFIYDVTGPVANSGSEAAQIGTQL